MSLFVRGGGWLEMGKRAAILADFAANDGNENKPLWFRMTAVTGERAESDVIYSKQVDF